MKFTRDCKPPFALALLPLALLGGLAHAADSATLDPVKVEADKLAEQIEVRKKMDRSTATDLRDVLKDEASVQFGGGNGGTSQWMTIRGMGQDQIDVVVDGASNDSQIFHHQSRHTLDPSLVRIIGVEKGAGSASAGIGAVAGRVKAETLDASDLLEAGRNFGARINAGVRSNRGHVRGLTLYGRTGIFDALLSANQARLREYKDGRGNIVKGSEIKQDGYLAKFGIQPHQDHRVELSYRREEFDGNRSFRNEFMLQPPMNTEHHSDTFNVEYVGRNMGFVDALEFNAFHTKTEDVKRPLGKPLNPAAPSLRRGEVETYGANTAYGSNLGLTSRVSSLLTLKYGVNWRHSKSENRVSSSQNKTDTGVYVEGIWNLAPVTLTTGARYDHYSYTSSAGHRKTEGRINPSIGAVWDVAPDFSLNAVLNTASRSPRLHEAMLVADNRKLAPDLRGEQTRRAEVGFKYDNGALAVSGSYYQQRIRHFNRNVGTTLSSIGTLKNTGYELSSRYKWRGLVAKAGMAYNTPKLNGAYYDSVASAVPMGRQWNTGLSYRFENPKLEVGWQGRYAQRRSYTNSNGATVTRKGFGVHDIYVNWQPLGKDTFNVNLAVNNVGNKHYFSHSQRTSRISLPEAGRDIRLSMNYRF
ncbi:MAG: TonB-dependent receptor [Brachymonas sp.]|nr:TonB-dependent receptor [Brachymonas sp.]